MIKDQRGRLKQKFWLLCDVFLSHALEPDLHNVILGSLEAEGPRLVPHGLADILAVESEVGIRWKQTRTDVTLV